MENLTFTCPWAFAALLVLPLLWWLVRLTPPRPKRILFGAFPLLHGLQTDQQITARAPWWLWLLRLALAAVIITAAAGPQWQLAALADTAEAAPLILIMDDDAVAAAHWPWLQSQAAYILQDAAQNNRPVLWLTTTTANNTGLQLPGAVAAQIASTNPHPWLADLTQLADRLNNNTIAPDAEIVWLSGGAYPNFPTILSDALENYGKLTVLQPGPQLGWISNWHHHQITLQRFPATAPTDTIKWLDRLGHVIAAQTVQWPSGQTQLAIPAELPPGTAHQVAAAQLAGQTHAGATWLMAPAGLPPTGIVRGAQPHTSTPLLDPVYYLNNALQSLGQKPQLDRLEILLEQRLPAIILPDMALNTAQQEGAYAYIEQGGTLIRWLGPALLQAADDTLYPIPFLRQLRQAGSLTEPADYQRAAVWDRDNPLQNVAIPNDLAFRQTADLQPAPPAATVLGSLQNHTPWLASQPIGQGRLIMVYTTATPEWSNLALTPLMPALLAALLQQAGPAPAPPTGASLGHDWLLQQAVNAFGQLVPPPQSPPSLAQPNTPIGSAAPPGRYQNNTSAVFLNLGAAWQDLHPFTAWPATTEFEYRTAPPAATDLSGYGWLAAWLLLLVDTYMTLAMRGLWPRWLGRGAAAAMGLLIMLAAQPAQAAAPLALGYLADSPPALAATLEFLQANLAARTTAQFGPPNLVDLATTNLAPFPLLFWAPVGTTALSAQATANLQQYLAKGGLLILFVPPNAATPAAWAQNLALPALQPVPATHVLWHSFYLLQPGAWLTSPVWLDQSAAQHENQIASVIILPTDLLTDLTDPESAHREIALRLLINVAIYALTGDYKTDQVHLPYILDRLGQHKSAK